MPVSRSHDDLLGHNTPACQSNSSAMLARSLSHSNYTNTKTPDSNYSLRNTSNVLLKSEKFGWSHANITSQSLIHLQHTTTATVCFTEHLNIISTGFSKLTISLAAQHVLDHPQFACIVLPFSAGATDARHELHWLPIRHDVSAHNHDI